ncbi:Transcriptional activator NphR [Poriferisphaera corsica]|uniref:Transcriptional activator NphR n=1 Tax=Poriferisphaera corsica TaxID=2528020 RepID=A0A517YQ15_9BACT|nr:helix-turn-helix domain-containing protein [Poriferisphaera corsica]QDU32315.1 Transcriptional activator NphR [Poriferisphaera corsica]
MSLSAISAQHTPDIASLPAYGNPDDIFQIYPVLEMGSVAPHIHNNFYEVQYFARGNAILRHQGGDIPLRTPCLHICPPAPVWHEIVCDRSTVWTASIAIYPRLLKRDDIDVPDHHEAVMTDVFQTLLQLAQLDPPMTELKHPAARRIERLITVMSEEFRLRLPGYLVRLRSCLEELIIIAYREQHGIHVHPSIINTSTENESQSSHKLGDEIQLERDRRVANAIKWMRSNLHDVVSNKDISHSLKLTEKHFVRLFSNEVGISPQRYHLRLRLEASAEYLINTEMSVSSIAQTFGFKHPSHFHRRFREFYGSTPSLYRYFNRQQTS